MKKQFDLQYYLEHPETKVVTRDGRNVRIVCTDAKEYVEKRHVVALYSNADGEREIANRFYDTGKYIKDRETPYDLFFDLPDQEKKKVPLTHEDLLERVKAGKTMWMHSTLKEVNGCDIVRFVIDFDRLRVYYALVNGIENYSYYDLIDIDMHFADGTPCWKEVEE